MYESMELSIMASSLIGPACDSSLDILICVKAGERLHSARLTCEWFTEHTAACLVCTCRTFAID